MSRSDLPLDRNAAGLFLPAIMGFMVFLAALAFASSMAANNLLSRWQSTLQSAFTVQLPPIDGESPDAANARRERVLSALAAIPGVESASLLSSADKARLLAPWLGSDVAVLDLPLPDLIAVTLRAGSVANPPGLTAKLQAISPGAAIDDHGYWRSAIAAIARAAAFALAGLLLLIGAASALTVVFVARAGLTTHRRVIEILHIIGAHDSYIAGQFQRHAFSRGMAGGIIGASAAAAIFLAASRLLPGLNGGDLALQPLQWVAFALLPVAAAILAMATARYTVLRALRRTL